MLALLACGAGLFLGLNFNILALLPVSVLGAGAYIVTSMFAGASLFQSACLVIIPLIAVQLGYFAGLTARDAYKQLRVRLKLGQSGRA